MNTQDVHEIDNRSTSPGLGETNEQVLAEGAWDFWIEDRSLRNRAAHWGCELLKVPEGVTCTFCNSSCPALPINHSCGHAACASCWARHAEKELLPVISFSHPLKYESLPRVQCLCCSEEVSWPLLCVSGRYSETLLCVLALCDTNIMIEEKKRLYRNMPDCVFQSAATAFASRCDICQEVYFATVSNRCCGHNACYDCWLKWAASQTSDALERCALLTRVSSSASLPCFGHGCKQFIEAPLWKSLINQCDDLALFDHQMARRRKLVANALYPREMQVECPMPTCYGLGYLGFDSVMCFVCEHQWLPTDPGAAPCDINVEELMGVKVKRCPKCFEFIEKNGGCDHMTCRCKHEFYWTSLQPYRR